MEYGSIERELHIEAAPEVVYQVISTPEHLRQWWPDEADIEPVPGATGTLSFGSSCASVVPLTVVEADPPRRFSFHWAYDSASPTPLTVTFDLVPSGTGTLVRFSETGFREKGWEAATLEDWYRDHSEGWDRFLPRLVTYVATLVSAP
jgi:uncharacterized protein YndB with AHSA1/START domain